MQNIFRGRITQVGEITLFLGERLYFAIIIARTNYHIAMKTFLKKPHYFELNLKIINT